MSLAETIEELGVKIRGKLYVNYLKNMDGKYLVRPDNETPYSVEQVALSMIKRGGSTARPEDIVKNVNGYFDESVYLLANGFPVRNKYYDLTSGITGTVDGPDVPIDPARNRVEITFRVRSSLRSILKKIKILIEGVAAADCYVGHVFDVRSNTTNDALSPGGVLFVHGIKIKIAGLHLTVGFYFVNQKTGERVKVTENFVENNPTQIAVMIPQNLGVGDWLVEGITQFAGGSKLLKEPRTFRFEQALRVGAPEEA
jgi:hypothetical protein